MNISYLIRLLLCCSATAALVLPHRPNRVSMTIADLESAKASPSHDQDMDTAQARHISLSIRPAAQRHIRRRSPSWPPRYGPPDRGSRPPYDTHSGPPPPSGYNNDYGRSLKHWRGNKHSNGHHWTPDHSAGPVKEHPLESFGDFAKFDEEKSPPAMDFRPSAPQQTPIPVLLTPTENYPNPKTMKPKLKKKSHSKDNRGVRTRVYTRVTDVTTVAGDDPPKKKKDSVHEPWASGFNGPNPNAFNEYGADDDAFIEHTSPDPLRYQPSPDQAGRTSYYDGSGDSPKFYTRGYYTTQTNDDKPQVYTYNYAPGEKGAPHSAAYLPATSTDPVVAQVSDYNDDYDDSFIDQQQEKLKTLLTGNDDEDISPIPDPYKENSFPNLFSAQETPPASVGADDDDGAPDDDQGAPRELSDGFFDGQPRFELPKADFGTSAWDPASSWGDSFFTSLTDNIDTSISNMSGTQEDFTPPDNDAGGGSGGAEESGSPAGGREEEEEEPGDPGQQDPAEISKANSQDYDYQSFDYPASEGKTEDDGTGGLAAEVGETSGAAGGAAAGSADYDDYGEGNGEDQGQFSRTSDNSNADISEYEDYPTQSSSSSSSSGSNSMDQGDVDESGVGETDGAGRSGDAEADGGSVASGGHSDEDGSLATNSQFDPNGFEKYFHKLESGIDDEVQRDGPSKSFDYYAPSGPDTEEEEQAYQDQTRKEDLNPEKFDGNDPYTFNFDMPSHEELQKKYKTVSTSASELVAKVIKL